MRAPRTFGAVAVVAALALAGCSSDKGGDDAKKEERPQLSFGTSPENADKLKICQLYQLADMKELVGGGKRFQVQAPRTLKDQSGPDTTGVECAWKRTDKNGDERDVMIDVTDFAKAADGLISTSYDGIVSALGVSSPIPNLGEAAVGASGKGATTVVSRKGTFVVVATSHGTGDLDPVALDRLTLLAGAAVQQVG